MKWIFLIALLFGTPALAALLKSERKWIPVAAFALALLPFLESAFNIVASPYSWSRWQGYAKGIDLSFVDAVAIALIFSTQRISTPWVIRGAFGLYLLAYLISSLGAQYPIPAFFYGWQLLRVVLVYYAVARAAAMSDKVPVAILTGLIIGLVSQAGLALTQYGGGDERAGGSFGHPNLLGMVSHFAVYPVFAVFLGGFYAKRAALAVPAALIVAFSGGSRATIGLIAAGLVMTAALSLWKQASGRKLAVAGLGLLMLLAASPLLYLAIERRPAAARAQSNMERAQMQDAARMIIADYPLGSGANGYVTVANIGGYSARAGVPWNEANRAAPVHNAYYLVAAEMSLLGLIGFLSVLGSIFYLGVSTFRRMRSGFQSDYALGMVVSVVMVAIHSYFEWIVMLFPVHMMLGLTTGLFVGLRAGQAAGHRLAKNAPAARVGTPLPVR